MTTNTKIASAFVAVVAIGALVWAIPGDRNTQTNLISDKMCRVGGALCISDNECCSGTCAKARFSLIGRCYPKAMPEPTPPYTPMPTGTMPPYTPMPTGTMPPYTPMPTGQPPRPTGLSFYPLQQPVRLLDTRPGTRACFTPGIPLRKSVTISQQATGACSGIPSYAQALVGNVTIVNPSAQGYLTLYPSDTQTPQTSNISFSPNQTIANSFTVRLGSDGAFTIYPFASTNLVIDVIGYYAPANSIPIPTPPYTPMPTGQP